MLALITYVVKIEYRVGRTKNTFEEKSWIYARVLRNVCSKRYEHEIDDMNKWASAWAILPEERIEKHANKLCGVRRLAMGVLHTAPKLNVAETYIMFKFLNFYVLFWIRRAISHAWRQLGAREFLVAEKLISNAKNE